MLYASVATLCLVWFLLSFEHVQCRSTGQVNEYSSRSSPTRRCLRSCFLISGHQTCYEKCLGRNKEGDFNLNARIMRIPPHLTPSLKRRKRNANGFSKKCYTCQSAVSWEDCLKNSKVFECKKRYPGIPEADLACITLARSKLRTWNQQIVHFAKFCLPKNMCDKEKCEKDMLPREEYNITKARGCDIECCSGDICNDGKLPVVALAEVTGFSKKCYTCQSAISWEDCLKNRKGFECKNLYPGIPEADPACITVARSKLGTWNQQIAHFATFCSPKNMCDKEKCEKDMLPREEYKITKATAPATNKVFHNTATVPATNKVFSKAIVPATNKVFHNTVVPLTVIAITVVLVSVISATYLCLRKRKRGSHNVPTDDADYDAFIIFNQHDQKWVDEVLLQILEKESNYKCCVHYRDFTIGKDFVTNMTDSVQNSRKVIAVISKTFFSSKWCNFELQQAIYKHIKKGDDGVIVIKIDNVSTKKFPKAIQTKSFIDYSNRVERPFFKRRLLRVLESTSNDEDIIPMQIDG